MRPIDWRVHFDSSPDEVWSAWTSDEGRARFWGDSSRSFEGGFELGFVNGESLSVAVEEARPPERLVFRYFGGSRVSLDLESDGRGGCDLRLREDGAPEPLENYAGWVSVLLVCKAAVDFGIDLRSRDPERNWDVGFVDV